MKAVKWHQGLVNCISSVVMTQAKINKLTTTVHGKTGAGLGKCQGHQQVGSSGSRQEIGAVSGKSQAKDSYWVINPSSQRQYKTVYNSKVRNGRQGTNNDPGILIDSSSTGQWTVARSGTQTGSGSKLRGCMHRNQGRLLQC